MFKIRNRLKFNIKDYVITFSIIITCIMLGFASLSRTLGVESKNKIGKIDFDVHFDNLIISSGSMEALAPAQISSTNDKEINFSLEFTEPGQKYEFEVDVVNNGTLDAMLDSFTTTSLTTSESKYLEMSFSYLDGTELQVKDLLKEGNSERIKFKVEFKRSISLSDMPKGKICKNLTFSLIYRQDDGSANQRTYGGQYYFDLVNRYATLDNIKSTYVSSISGIDFSTASSNTNGKGLYVKAGTENDEYPIYYYRGAVNDNNVLFAGKCWKIVRTTETGGTKIIYNGVPNTQNSLGMCGNNGNSSAIGAGTYSSTYSNLGYSGYMHSLKTPEYKYASKSYFDMGIYETIPIEEEEYIIIQNDEKYPFMYDKKSKSWINYYDNNISSNKVAMEFHVSSEGEYYFYFDNTYNSSFALATLKLSINGTLVGYSSNKSGASSFKIGTLKPSDVVSVYFSKAFLNESNTYRFNIGRTTEDCQDNRFLFGSSIKYIDGNYKLVNATKAAYGDDLSNYYYTCFSTSDTCSSAYYIYSKESTSVYYMLLTNGKDIEQVLDDLLPNDETRNYENSNIKDIIDDWFVNSNELTNFKDKLEDTIWCNDRTIGSLGGWDPRGTSITKYFEFQKATADRANPSLSCPNKYDRFTLKSSIENNNPDLDGNQALDYPVGLLTLDEISMAGIGNTSFVNSGISYWLMTPHSLNYYNLYNYSLSSTGSLTKTTIYSNIYIRPSVSLNKGVKIISGNGSPMDPFVIV